MASIKKNHHSFIHSLTKPDNEEECIDDILESSLHGSRVESKANLSQIDSHGAASLLNVHENKFQVHLL